MKKNKLGKSDLSVSSLSLGCMSFKSPKANQAKDIIRKAHDAGINFFDTADLYEKGANEILVGECVRSFRQEIILATKVGNQWRADGKEWDWKASKPYIIKAIEASLSRLKTDYIDLYQLHGGTIDDPIDEIIEAFELLKQQGKIRAYGISSIRQNVIREYVKKSNIDTVMMPYNLLDRRLEEEIGALLLENQISILARGTVANGLLINKDPNTYLQYTESEVKHVLRNIVQFVSQHGWSKLQVAIAFVLTNPVVSSAVVGISSADQLDDLIVLKSSILKLNEKEKAALLNGVRSIYFTEHR